MRKDVLDYILSNHELKKFLREQPIWYRKLSRNPNDLEAFEIAYLHAYEKTFPHQVEKISNGIQMVSMMLSMFQMMNENQ